MCYFYVCDATGWCKLTCHADALLGCFLLTMSHRFPPKTALSMGDRHPHLTHGSLGPPESPSKMAFSLVLRFLQGSQTLPTDRPTDHATPCVATCCYHQTRCGLTIQMTMLLPLSSQLWLLWEFTQFCSWMQTRHQVATNPHRSPPSWPLSPSADCYHPHPLSPFTIIITHHNTHGQQHYLLTWEAMSSSKLAILPLATVRSVVWSASFFCSSSTSRLALRSDSLMLWHSERLRASSDLYTVHQVASCLASLVSCIRLSMSSWQPGEITLSHYHPPVKEASVQPACMYETFCYLTCNTTSAMNSLSDFWKIFCLGVSWSRRIVTYFAYCAWEMFLLTNSLTHTYPRATHARTPCPWQSSSVSWFQHCSNVHQLIDWVKVLRPTRYKMGHLGDVLPSQSLGLVVKKWNKHSKSKHASVTKYTIK